MISIKRYNKFIFENIQSELNKTSPLLNLKDNVDHDLINVIESLISSGKILEISCGNGADAIELDRLGYQVTATENNKNYAEHTNQFVSCIHHDTKNKFPFTNNEFDLVYSRLGLHYFSQDELIGIFGEISRITKNYLVFTVKLVNDISTGKVIFDQKFWEDLTSRNFEIVSSKVKTGILYNNESKWLEVVSKKRSSKLNENKMWYKTIPEILSWIELKSENTWAWLDTETTGLPSDDHEVQLTQVSAIATKYNFHSNTFKELDSYDKKIKLTDVSLQSMKDPTSRIKKVLTFNHYGQKGIKYNEEGETLQDFFTWLKKFNNPMLVIQNAIFDMRYLNTRNPVVKFDNEVIDTKMIIQLYYLPLLQKLAETDPKYKEMVSKIGTSERDNGLISSSMSKIGPALNINMSGYHDALSDCKLIINIFTLIIDLLKDHQNEDITKYQSERIKTIRK